MRRAAASVISEDLNILGNLISEGYIDINGHIEGNVKCDSLTIRPEGSVKGDIFVNHIHVHGQVSGIIKARSVHLASTAQVRGVIIHETMSVEDGAFIDGQCKRTERHQIADMSNRSHSDEPKMETLENPPVRLISDRK